MYSYDRVAAAKLDSAVLKSIAKATEQNDVPRALMLGAKKLEQKFELIGKLQELEGHLPSGLKTYRESLYTQLMDLAKRDLSDEDYQKFYMSY